MEQDANKDQPLGQASSPPKILRKKMGNSCFFIIQTLMKLYVMYVVFLMLCRLSGITNSADVSRDSNSTT